jgi:hypothetical protein
VLTHPAADHWDNPDNPRSWPEDFDRHGRQEGGDSSGSDEGEDFVVYLSAHEREPVNDEDAEAPGGMGGNFQSDFHNAAPVRDDSPTSDSDEDDEYAKEPVQPVSDHPFSGVEFPGPRSPLSDDEEDESDSAPRDAGKAAAPSAQSGGAASLRPTARDAAGAPLDEEGHPADNKFSDFRFWSSTLTVPLEDLE